MGETNAGNAGGFWAGNNNNNGSMVYYYVAGNGWSAEVSGGKGNSWWYEVYDPERHFICGGVMESEQDAKDWAAKLCKSEGVGIIGRLEAPEQRQDLEIERLTAEIAAKEQYIAALEVQIAELKENLAAAERELAGRDAGIGGVSEVVQPKPTPQPDKPARGEQDARKRPGQAGGKQDAVCGKRRRESAGELAPARADARTCKQGEVSAVKDK